ncbi:alpha-1D adrenergic receptor [Astyanax mexicanus]|uniref:Alpha-1D adrenergic receptor n=2 Tax=Astyanax mexicanus TaxID=7994 RepID=A0A8T2KRF5_ASTMX|nr:alpha-1D adrenergic receptor [Astyanax mexicanus]KAG9259616.1 alpha-1D adrenergic receptor [Astyanax mexicanus]
MTFFKLVNESKDAIEALNETLDVEPLLVNSTITKRSTSSRGANLTCTGILLEPQVVAVGVFLAIFITVAIVGNILVILSVLCNRHLRTVTNFFIVNLAIADLLLGVVVLPFSASLEVLGCWVFGRVFCNIWAAVDVLCCTASILSLCIISVDRYVGVKYCLRYPTIMTERKAGVILVVIWVASAVISIGPLLGWKEPPPADESVCSITEEPGYALFSSLFSFYLPLSVILVMYFRVYVVARRTSRSLEAGVKRERGTSTDVVLRIHCRSLPEEALEHSRSRGRGQPFRSSLSVRLMKFSREKKAAKTLAIVVGMFVLCWLPFFFVLPLGSFFPALKPSDMVFKVIFWLGYFNSCINPIIYPCSSKEFQRAFTRLLRCQCHRRRRALRRFYDQRWRTAIKGPARDSRGEYRVGLPLHESCGGSSVFSSRSKGRSLRIKSWSFFPPLQKSSFHLKEKMNNLSNKIKSGAGKSAAPALGRTEIDTVAMGIYSECGDPGGYQIYDLPECYGLKETDI